MKPKKYKQNNLKCKPRQREKHQNIEFETKNI